MAWGDLNRNLSAAVTSSATFGGEVLFTPQAGPAATLQAAFSATYVEATPEGVPVTTNTPNLFCTLAGLGTEPRPGDQVTRQGTVYRVSEVHEDGEGGVHLLLHEVT